MKKIDYINYQKPSDYMKFDEGENRIRVVSSGGLVMVHGMKTAKGFVNLGVCTENENCEHCKKGYEAKMKWRWIVFSFKDNDVKFLDAGSMLGNQLCEFGDDPQNFDVIVTRTGQKLNTEYKARKAVKDEEISDEVKKSIAYKKKKLIEKYFK